MQVSIYTKGTAQALTRGSQNRNALGVHNDLLLFLFYEKFGT
jgi:hypothetical protein